MWETAVHVQTRVPRALLRIALDANGRVGSVPSACIGRYDSETENDNGARLRHFATEFGLSVVNAFWRIGPTWTSSRLTRHRIDYVLADDKDDVVKCEVKRDIDLTVYQGERIVVCGPSGSGRFSSLDSACRRNTNDNQIDKMCDLSLDTGEASGDRIAELTALGVGEVEESLAATLITQMIMIDGQGMYRIVN